MYNKILVALALGGNNQYIEDKVIELQKLTGADVTVINVVRVIPSIYAVGEEITFDERFSSATLMKNAENALLPAAKRLGVGENNIVIKQGHEGDEVLEYAKDNHFDLIVTGSHGRHGLRLLLGSTANSILHGALCDVLAVRLKE